MNSQTANQIPLPSQFITHHPRISSPWLIQHSQLVKRIHPSNQTQAKSPKAITSLTELSQLILLGESLSKCNHQEDQNVKSLYVLLKADKTHALTALP